MKRILLLLFILVGSFGFAMTAYSAPILLTLSESDNGVTQTWWPDKLGSDNHLTDVFGRYGLDIVRPAMMSNVPRLSPTVYAPQPLTQSNAQNLASLFGASHALNGKLEWQCEPVENAFKCTLAGSVSLTGRREARECSRTVSIQAKSIENAKKILLNQYAAECSPQFLQANSPQQTLPKLIDKPVVIFDPIPDADALVALRKQLKRVAGVNDVAERWIANGMLAIEINPDQKQLSQEEFSRIIQAFVNEKAENMIIRLTRQTEVGAVFEVAKY
ncbi:MAG: hypothetical protein J6A01_09815 [Proteobacteria bacterium]|nr:hypothetical protein [Pseudomonadota bacterium]